MKKNPLHSYLYILPLIALFMIAALMRPILPIDETRYYTVAWEMFLSKNYSLLSLNFAPYHHKPPMLFWLINLCWEIFGVSRYAGMIPIFIASSLVLILSKMLANLLTPDQKERNTLVPWLLLGSVPFLIYSTIVMFDIMLTCAVLGVLICFIHYAQSLHKKHILLAGLIMGLGVLIKGPVAYLYIVWPIILYAYWRMDHYKAGTKNIILALLVAILISAVPVLMWLIPALSQADGGFAYWLIWEQTAGRVQGNFSSSHARPIYFYIVLAPVLFLPWAFYPSFWRNIKQKSLLTSQDKFLLAATLPVFLSFSLISGKQPHYLLPLLPYICILFSQKIDTINNIKRYALWMVAFFIVVETILCLTKLKDYDLTAIATYQHEHNDRDFAYAGKYQGEIGFLSRATKPMDTIHDHEWDEWFTNHPSGMMIIRHDEAPEQYFEIFSAPYRGKRLGIFVEKQK